MNQLRTALIILGNFSGPHVPGSIPAGRRPPRRGGRGLYAAPVKKGRGSTQPPRMCQKYSNSKDHKMSSQQKRDVWLEAAEACCCQFTSLVFVPISDGVRENSHHGSCVLTPAHTHTHTYSSLTFHL